MAKICEFISTQHILQEILHHKLSFLPKFNKSQSPKDDHQVAHMHKALYYVAPVTLNQRKE